MYDRYTGRYVNQVGRYEIVEELGRGAMGVVYKALDPTIGRTIAVKAIRLSDLPDPVERKRVRDRLLREAQSAGILSHPNIVTIYDILEQEDMAYIFMEYVNGSSLEKALRTKSLPEKTALLDVLRQVAGALDYAHRKGIIHRDIKPANVMFACSGPHSESVTKITDFGVAKFASHDLTQSGTMIGTPNYMSPEQIQGLTADARSDQFSLAVMMYEVLAGVKPFESDNLPTLFYWICKEEPKPVHEINPTLNVNVHEVLRRALAKTPNDRFSSCSEFIGALGVVLGACQGWTPGIHTQRTDAPAVMGATAIYALSDVSGLAAVLDKEAEAEPRRATAKRKFPELRSANAIRESPEPGSANAKRESPEPQAATQSGAPPTYDLPPSRPRRLYQEPGDDFNIPDPRDNGQSGWRKWAVAFTILLAVAGGIIFLLQWKPAPNLPVQVLDTKSGDTAPPPVDKDDSKKASEPEKSEPEKPRAPIAARKADSDRPPETKRVPEMAEIIPPAKLPSPRPPGPVNETPSGVTANVDLLSDPPGAQITIDGKSTTSCKAPCTVSLPNGRHTLLAESSGYNPARRVFSVPQDNTVYVQLGKTQGMLVITSIPAGVQVFIDGKLFGQTPSTLHLSVGKHHLLLVNGSMRHEENLEIVNDGFTTRSFRWEEH
jgi:serine/threonine-protein kinase